MKAFKVTGGFLRFIILIVLFNVLFIGGAQAVAAFIPDIQSEPGLVSAEQALLIISVTCTLLIIALIKKSRFSGWKLALGLAFAYYGLVTFMMQIETWYFLSDVTVGAELLPRLFLMGLPIPFIFIPLAVWILGKGKGKNAWEQNRALMMPVRQWVWKLVLIALAYLILYWSAGYFIAWQNPELRAFYGSPGEMLPFWVHTINTLSNDPGLFPFQILRAMLWVAFSLPVIRGSKCGPWGTAILLGLLFSLPQNIGHIMENPLMPIASVRLSHMIETASSTFIFGMIVVWLLHREHKSWRDLFGL